MCSPDRHHVRQMLCMLHAVGVNCYQHAWLAVMLGLRGRSKNHWERLMFDMVLKI
uniref:Uncharacterized protein n=1 Tax=Oryza brachyantha TaxID=4533 RepID=J3LPL3_ORYBR